MRVTAKLIGGTIKVDARLLSAIKVDAQIVNSVRSMDIQPYTGAYEVTSFCADPLLTTSLVLPTADKHMMDDLTIYSVPTREEPNEAGGVTFIVGG